MTMPDERFTEDDLDTARELLAPWTCGRRTECEERRTSEPPCTCMKAEEKLAAIFAEKSHIIRTLEANYRAMLDKYREGPGISAPLSAEPQRSLPTEGNAAAHLAAAAIPEGMVLVRRELVEAAQAFFDSSSRLTVRDGLTHNDRLNAKVRLRDALAAHSAAQEKKP